MLAVTVSLELAQTQEPLTYQAGPHTGVQEALGSPAVTVSLELEHTETQTHQFTNRDNNNRNTEAQINLDSKAVLCFQIEDRNIGDFVPLFT